MTLAAVPCRGRDTLIDDLFAPLGYAVATDADGVGPDKPAPEHNALGHEVAQRDADPRLRAAPGPRQPEALLDRRCGTRQAHGPRQGLARGPPPPGTSSSSATSATGRASRARRCPHSKRTRPRTRREPRGRPTAEEPPRAAPRLGRGPASTTPVPSASSTSAAGKGACCAASSGKPRGLALPCRLRASARRAGVPGHHGRGGGRRARHDSAPPGRAGSPNPRRNRPSPTATTGRRRSRPRTSSTKPAPRASPESLCGLLLYDPRESVDRTASR